MGFRFRKSIKICKGVRVNLGKSGVSSLSLGGRGASLSIGKRGTALNTSIPGTGISYRSNLSGGSRGRQSGPSKTELKAQERELRRQEDENIALRARYYLEDDGKLSILCNYGELTRNQARYFWEYREDEIIEFLKDKIEEINENSEYITEFYQLSPNPNEFYTYTPQPYSEEEPIAPLEPIKKVYFNTPKDSFLNKIFPWLRKSYLKKVNSIEAQNLAIDAQFDLEFNEYKKVLEIYELKYKEWNDRKQKWDEHENYLSVNFHKLLDEDKKFLDSAIEEVISSVAWPRETFVSYEVFSNTIYLDVDLPEIEDLPQRHAKFATNNRKLIIKNKTDKQKRLDYSKHIHGIAMYLTSQCFSLIPFVESAVVSGYSQRISKATGYEEDEYLFSFKIDREGFSRINFDNLVDVDPVLALENFEHIRKMTSTGIFKPIRPYDSDSNKASVI